MEPSSLLAAFLVPGLRDGGASLPRVLQEVAELCIRMQESRMVCLRVHARLCGVWQRELQFAMTTRALRKRVAPVIAVFGELLVRFRAMLRRFGTDDRVFRLILNRQLFVKLDQMHRDIDAVQLAIGVTGNSQTTRQQQLIQMKLERVQWEADRRVQLQLDRHRSGYTAAVQRELHTISERDELLSETLTQVREVIAATGTSAYVQAETDTEADEQRVVVLVVTKQDASEKPALTIRDWWLARRDSVFDAGAGVRGGSVAVVAAHNEDQDTATASGSEPQCIRWSGYRVVRSHSACHLCTPVAFAFEDATETSSRFIETCVTTHRAELVALLYQAELCLHFAHEDELSNSSNNDDDGGDLSLNLSLCGFDSASSSR